jgi:hypothetical protein
VLRAKTYAVVAALPLRGTAPPDRLVPRRGSASSNHCAGAAARVPSGPRFVAAALVIHSRLEIVQTRTWISDCEGDLIVGRQSRSAIGTLVDRTSRAVRLIHLPNGHGADALIEAVTPVLAMLSDRVRMTLTWDQGSEMARHDLVADHLDEGVYFRRSGEPLAAWQQREHERLAASVLSQGPRPLGIHLQRPRRSGEAPQRPSTQDLELANARVRLRGQTGTIRPRCCDGRTNPL